MIMKEYGWTIIGFVFAALFGILGMIFLILKGKACVLISGYNFKTESERKGYDETRLSRDERNFFFVCAMIYFMGAVVSIFAGAIAFWISFAVWFVYFLKNVHLDSEKAFDQYKKR